jgi:hypothetical protein
MPYEIRGPIADGKYEVVNSETQSVKHTCDTKEDAERKMRLLNEVDSEENWKEE